MNLKMVERTEYANLNKFVSDWDVTEAELEPFLHEEVDEVDFDSSIVEQVDEPDKTVIDEIVSDREGMFHTRFDRSNGGSIVIKLFELHRERGNQQRISLNEDDDTVEVNVEGCVDRQLFIDFFKDDSTRLLYYPKGQAKPEIRPMEMLE